MLLLALGVGAASGVTSALLGERAIRAHERARYRREILNELGVQE